MRGVKRAFGMPFTPHGRLTRHIRAPRHQRKARASTGKLGGIGRGKRAGRAVRERGHASRAGESEVGILSREERAMLCAEAMENRVVPEPVIEVRATRWAVL